MPGRGFSGRSGWDCIAALSAGAFGFVFAILLALTGLPEVEQNKGKN